jgi:predicted amidohydrolase
MSAYPPHDPGVSLYTRGRMPKLRIALAQPPYPASRDESVNEVERLTREAADKGARVVVFPECFVPGYRGLSYVPAPPDAPFLERAWQRISEAARSARIGVVLGTERVTERGLLATALVIGPEGERLGFQDKVQLDPTEDEIYVPGETRRVFSIGPLTFGVVICHEGWRYPETTRWAVRHGAHVVFHPHLHAPEPGDHRPTRFGEKDTSFHERSILSRAAENTAYFASVNYAIDGSATSSAVAAPDGTLLSHMPYGRQGVLIAEIDTDLATGILAKRYRPIPE